MTEAPPALYNHCVNLFDKMFDLSFKTENDLLIYEGYLVNLVTKELNLSTPYYTHCTRALKEMECIKLVRRGGGRAPSQWQLFHAPSVKLFTERIPIEEQSQSASVKSSLDRHQLAQNQVILLASKVSKLEEDYEELKRIVIGMSQKMDGKK